MSDAPEDVEWQLESRLTSHGVYVADLDREEAGVSLTYESISVDEVETVPHREVGRVINVFREVFGDEWEGERIEATATDLDGEPKGTWHVRAEWLSALADGDLSETEFSQKVIETIETVE